MVSIFTLALIASITGIAGVLTLSSVPGSRVLAQAVITGEWKGSLAKKDDSKINLNFEMRRNTDSDKWGEHTIGHTFEFSELGLTREQVLKGGPVTFRFTREAGTIEGEGNFQNEKGSGTYRFTPNSGFVSAMKSRGFDFEKESNSKHESRLEERLFTAAILNVTTHLADDLLSANFGQLDVGDLFKAAIFKIDSAFMREMKATGFPNLSFNDLVKARIFHIDANFVRQAAQMGFGKEGFQSLVKMSIFKVTPEFVAEVRDAGLNDISVQDVVKLRIFHIDGDFIRKAKADGVPLEVQQLVKRKMGVQRSSRRVI
jgi:hypothetical protein